MTDAYDDDEGFIGYEETTVDPGHWLNVATALFCGLSIVLFPCMVSAGRRYEKYRMRMSKDQDDDVVEETEAEALQQTRQDSGVESSTPCSIIDGKSFEDGRETKSHKEKKMSEACSEGASSSYVHGKFTALPGSPIGHNTTGRKLQALIDRMIMPPYPDDVGLNIDIARTTAADIDSPGTGDSDKISTILDTGAGTRNRHVGARRYQRGLKDQKWHQEQELERRLSLMTLGQQCDHCDIHRAFAFAGPSQDLEDMPSTENNPSSDVAIDRSAHLSRSYTTKTSRGLRHRSSQGSESDIFVSPDDAVDANDPGVVPVEKVPMEGEELDLCCGAHAWWRPVMMAAALDRLLDIAEWDRETKRILNLSIPFSLAAIASGLFETIRVALVANFIGTDAVAAYTIVLLVLGLTQEFFGGFALTSASLCSQAIGRGNHKLAGEYVQISCILYTLCFIPNVVVWMFFTDDVVRLFGFNEATAQMAQEYARYFVIGQWFEGLDEAYGSLMEVIGHERYTLFMDVANEVFSTCIILTSLLTQRTTLSDIGIIEMATEALFFGLGLAITNMVGWAKNYNEGMYRSKALRNKIAVRTVFRTAIPLALGQLLQYGEWEILTVFIAALGTAEVTTWGIVGSIWDTLEALTEGFGDAGEIRVAYHLGAARPAEARLSSYKSIVVSIICSTLITSVMWIFGESLATWMTPDPTLQRLIIEVLPLMGIGNIALATGTVSWALVGAQGRYRLATFVAFIGSWCVTLPLAAILTYGLNIDLQGVTSAVVIGYTFTGTCLLYVLVRSDWDRLSRIVVELNAKSGSSSSSDSSSSPSPPNDDELTC